MDNQTLGRAIRRVRIEKSLRLDDLFDDHISSATISRAENGMQISDEKMRYLLKKLEITKDELLTIANGIKKQDEYLLYSLLAVESILDHHGPAALSEARLCLRHVAKDVDNCNPYLPFFTYLKGKKQRIKKNFLKAEKYFLTAIDQTTYSNKNNIKSSTYNELGLIAYQQNDINKAIKYTKLGLEHFSKKENRNYIEYALKTNLALYYEKIGNLKKASKVLDDLWNKYHLIENANLKVLMHFIQSRIHHHEQKFQQAIELIFKGIELARINNFSSSEFTLWNELGAIFLSKKEYEAAERCLYSAGEIAKLKKIEKPFVKTLLQLGLLHLTIGKIADAESYISKAEQLAKKHNDALKLIEALEMYSKFYSFQHKYNEAIVKLLEARSLTQKYEFHYLEANILYRLSEYYQIIGNKAKMQKCLIERFNIEQRLGEEIIHEVRG